MNIPNWKRPGYLPADVSIGTPTIVGVALKYVRNRKLAIQAGAHVGVWPALLSSLFTRVVTFEGVSKVWAASMDAVTADNVLNIPCVISDSVGERQISVAEEKAARYSGSSAVGEKGAHVPCMTLDSLPRWATDDCGLLMLDIEGHELPALRGATRILKQFRPVVTAEENSKSLRHRALGELETFMETFGYKIVARYGDDLVFVA